ncbi:hypothetical protein CERZMDRAFT_42813 [Cercospora zeae-maydis SCOH1-5]|uniref:Prion-inhibition and propagation HeLo domain-containing protein n=1 Tax=Cercospora zeae-maydis SCOH1-5 TaxID=717836 RepID=A0A6A6FE24_9PEZI|nr:hypothetical protein CERZMDRAFT_42813 [Cercospora zeae-maydis SCOH1-5]
MANPSYSIDVPVIWKECLDSIDAVIPPGGPPAPDQELPYSKLEVERLRLLAWGDAVGLREFFDEDRLVYDARLHQEQIKKVVLQTMREIHQIFNDVKKLKSRYGLIQVSRDGEAGSSSGGKGWLQKVGRFADFKLQRSGKAAALGQNMTWTIHDKTKFSRLLQETHQYIETLMRLFPGLNFKDALRREAGRNSNVSQLLMLERAAADDNPMFFDVTSERLGELGATHKRNSGLRGMFGHRRGVSGNQLRTKEPVRPATIEAAAASADPDAALTELEKRLDVIKPFETELGTGALEVSLVGPTSWSAKATAHMSWQNNQTTSSFSLESRTQDFVKSPHAAFDAYRRKKFVDKAQKSSSYRDEDEEDDVFFDPETSPKYESVNPGTVTIEGFALEVWDYEESYGIKRQNTFVVSTSTMEITIDRILRRIDELRTEPPRLGRNPQEDHLNLQDFLQSTATRVDPARAQDPATELSELYASLNRDDLFVDFLEQAAIFACTMNGEEACNFLWQMVLGVELARRMQQHPDSWVSGFTPRVLAKLIVSDQWIRNVEIVLKTAPVPEEFRKAPASAEDALKAETYNREGQVALKQERFEEAADLFTKALEIGGNNTASVIGRSTAYIELQKDREAVYDAWVATELEPTHAKAWAARGAANCILGYLDPALEAYTKAIQLAADTDEKAELEIDMEQMKIGIQDWNDEFHSTTDPLLKHDMSAKIRDEKWSMLGKTIHFHSHVHESQVDGLLHFAEKMRWPYLSEVRVTAEEAYSKMHTGGGVNSFVADWLYGLTLPGKHFAFKIMATLIQCSPSVAGTIGTAKFLESNVVLQKQSYWRARSVVGRVLGAMPGVKSLGGWVGPLPAVEISPPPAAGAFQPLLVRLKTRQIPPQRPVQAGDNTIYIGGRHDRFRDTKPALNEDIDAYIADMISNEAYSAPQPPAKLQRSVVVTSIGLKRVAPELGTSTTDTAGQNHDNGNEAEYRASVTFSITPGQQESVTYTLFTNPIFITLPTCYNGPHRAHRRELKRYQVVPWEAERLHEHFLEDDDQGGKDGDEPNCMVINATSGKGAEVLARAWCSERSKHAIVVRDGEPCLVCAIRGAQSLEIKVVIWVR